MNYLQRSFKDYFDILEETNIKTDIIDNESEYILVADLPNFKKEDIKIDYNKGYLTISAIRNSEENNYIQKERFYGEYRRSYYIGDIDETGISATYNEGTLRINVPKTEKATASHKIEIK